MTAIPDWAIVPSDSTGINKSLLCIAGTIPLNSYVPFPFPPLFLPRLNENLENFYAILVADYFEGAGLRPYRNRSSARIGNAEIDSEMELTYYRTFG